MNLLSHEISQSIKKVILQAGEIMLNASPDSLRCEQKSKYADFVTAYDLKVQEFLHSALREIIPNCRFLSEEGESDPLSGLPTFVIDPIDGTTNFVLGRGDAVISVGLLVDRAPIFGAVYNPYSKEYFHAVRDGGAFLNSKPIRVASRPCELGVAAIGTSPYHKDTQSPFVVRAFTRLLKGFGDLRKNGAAALELCYVACGRTDAYFEPILYPWDYTAGALIVSEAGGKVSDLDGAPPSPDKPCFIVAASEAAYPTALKLLQESL
ncbi:MAG: inositol monophosphatase [Clostridia bacterium]|nr:inositol monophosphatase [Clostridia bacterium]